MGKIVNYFRTNPYVAIIGGLALFFVLLALFQSGTDETGVEANGAKKVGIEVLVAQDVVTSTLTTSGTVIPQEYSVIRSLTPGTVQFLVPIGENISKGQPLFAITDTNIENNYFNILTSFNATQLLTEERVIQAELALSSSEARLRVAEKNYSAALLQTRENFSTAESTAVNTYNSAYNTLKRALTTLSTGALGGNLTQFRYRDILSSNFQLSQDASVQFDIARSVFTPLVPTASPRILGDQLNAMLTALELGKEIIDTTTVLLQSAVSGNDLPTAIAEASQNQALVNSAVTSVISAQNSLSTTDIQNELLVIQAENNLSLAELDVENAEISRNSARKSATIETTAARAQLDNASYNFSNLNLPAPFSGTVISHFVTLGEQVTVGQQLVEMGNLDLVEIITDIDSSFVHAVTIGDGVLINDSLEGFIAEIEPAGDIESGKVRIAVKRNNADRALIAGNVANVTFTLSFKGEPRIFIPIKTATIEESQSFVFVVEEMKAVKRVVTLGEIYGDKVTVLSGLSRGDVLIIPNGVFISEGDLIELETTAAVSKEAAGNAPNTEKSSD